MGILDSIMFNQRFNPAPAAGYDPSTLPQGLLSALTAMQKTNALPAMPTVPLANNLAMAPTQPPQQAMTGTGGPPGAPPPAPPPMPMQQPQMPMQSGVLGGGAGGGVLGGLKGFLNGPKGDALMGLLSGWAQGGTMQQSLGMGAQGAIGGMRTAKRKAQVDQFLQQANIDPAIKTMLADNPDLAEKYVMQVLLPNGDGQTAEIKNFKFLQEHPEFAKMLGNQGGALFGNPIAYKKPDGSIGYMLPSRNGGMQDLQAPDGTTWMGPFDKSSDTAAGTAQGEIRGKLPQDILTADQTVKEIDSLIANPGLTQITGKWDQYRPKWMMNDQGRDAMARYDQLKGRSFLQAYSTLRGGGAITEVEGQKAGDAMARMDRAQSDEDFITALKDFRDAVRDGVAKLRERAGQGTSSPAQQPAASGGWSVQQVQ